MTLIDRDELLKYLDDTTDENEWCFNQYNADWIYTFIEGAPVIEVETVKKGVVKLKDKFVETALNANAVKHGHWDYWAGHLQKCSVCGYEYNDFLECNNYCGNCGAKMDLQGGD